MKKLLAFILITLLTVTFVGCDFFGTTTDATGATTETTVEATLEASTSEEITTSIISTTEGQTTIHQTTTTEAQTTIHQTTTTEERTTTTEPQTTTTEDINPIVEIDFYSMNDFHGGTYSDISYLSYIGGYMKSKAEAGENQVIVASGDIFQGTALSNYYYGEPIVEVYNNIGFDGFALGNHEFDWGIDKITRYRDGDLDNGEMDYPLLAANIVYQDSGEPLENTIPYIVKEFNGVKVGVIGLIGQLENSISASRLINIEFTDPGDSVYYYSDILRTDEDCDIVVVYIHNGSGINSEIANFTDTHYVDAIFNGHSHSNEAYSINRSTGQPLVYAQASNRDTSLFAHISLTYNKDLGEVTSASSNVLGWYDVNSYFDQDIDDIITLFEEDPVYSTFVSEELTYVDDIYGKYDLSEWASSVIRDYVGIDVGAVNTGGFRNSMYEGILTMGDMIEIYPFDNFIKTCTMNGYDLKDLIDDLTSDGVVFDDSTYISSGTLYVNGVVADLSATYTVGAVDYIFDKDYYGFLDGDNITLTPYLMRDLLVEDLRNKTGNFNPNNGTSYIMLPNINLNEELKRWIFA